MIERRVEATSYTRLRTFLETEDVSDRRLTAEWLAGRLHVPLREAAVFLDQLAADGAVRRHFRPDGPAWFELVPPASRMGLKRILLGVATLVLSIAIVALGTMLHHVFYFAMGLGLGLLIAFAWLDWELRTRI